MIRDTFFSMPRFVNLCRKELVENWRANMLRFVMMYGLMATAFVWTGFVKYKEWPYIQISSGNTDPLWSFALSFFVVGIIILGMLSASFVMERMKSKTNRLATLMTPATMFEKYFSRWLIFTPGFLIAFIVAFKLADWTRVLIYMASFPEIEVISSMPLSHFSSWGIFEHNLAIALSISAYFFMQSLFVLGSSLWPKNAFVKTFAALVVIAIAYFAFGALLMKMFYSGGGTSSPPLSDDGEIMVAILLLLACFNWVLAYFRFKESEIINRW